MSSDVVMTVCHRPHYLKETLDSWQEVRGLDDWRMIFMLEPTHSLDANISIINKFRHPNKQLIFNQERLGVLRNPWHGFQKAFGSGGEFVLLAEEDIVVSDDTIEFFNFCRDEGRNRTEVVLVQGHSHDLLPVDESAIVEAERFNPLLWGTWDDRWRELIRDTWDHDYSTGDGAYMGWDWNLNLRLIPEWGRVSWKPEASRSRHIGQHGGAHMQPASFNDSVSPNWAAHRSPRQYRVCGR